MLFPLIYYSQYARAYSLSLLLFAIAAIRYIKIKNDHGIPPLFLFGITIAANIWVHFFSAVPLALMLIDICRGDISEYFYAIIPSFLLSFPLITSLTRFVSERLSQAPSVPGPAGYGMTVRDLLTNTPDELFNILFPWFILLPIYEFYKNRLPHVRPILGICLGTGH